ncbi:MAG: hypothetical protein K6G44_01815 [Lentisphaeria bacterium]|nr:hypothetical protein [Lentisphaeria bacterium]
MPITVTDFRRLADTASYANRSVVVDNANTPTDVNFRGSVFSHSKKMNEATMKAFRDALGNDPNYGAFGVHAFDTVIGSRAQMKKSLRACDINAVFSNIEALKEKRFANEEARQMETNPAFLELAPNVRAEVRRIIQSHWQGPNHDKLTEHNYALKNCKNLDDVAKLANNTIMVAIQIAKAKVGQGNGQGIQTTPQSEMPVDSNQPMGLSRLTAESTIGKYETSVEDRVKRGWAGAGMRVNFGATSRPAIFEKLKTNGVEPGFIYHNDWSQHDSQALMIDIRSQATQMQFNRFLTNNPKFRPDPRKNPPPTFLEIGLNVGRAHSTGIAYAAEYVLSKELDKLGQDPKLDSPLLKAIKWHFGDNVQKTDFPPADGSAATPQQLANLAKLKKDCFIPLRDAVMNYSTTAKNTDPNSQLPVFKHFSERHILKLDYNEGDRNTFDTAPKDSEFMLPERVIAKYWYGKGVAYHEFRVTTPDKASVGAVSEALANDITRLLGIPAQDLTLVRGQYSDGHPKIMLEAKFAEGYKDFDGVYIEDGRIKADVNAEPLGKYKAIFLALADYDAVGSHGQNKGFIGDPDDPNQKKTFFAIDPGHSLQGNGKNMEIRDNLSFVQKKFKNYSIFDDDTRFAKMQGVLYLRELRDTGAITKLFLDYGQKFNPQEHGISDAEKAIREQVMDNLLTMETEFLGQINKMTTACADQLSLYDALGEDPNTKPLQEGAIETIENLEKLTSPTTWKSEEGKVELNHLSVIEKTRIPWTAKKDDNGMLVYTSKKPLSQEIQQRLQAQAQKAPQGTMTVTIDSQGMATINVPMGNAQAFFDTFSEGNIAQLTHPTEYQQRLAAHPQPPAQAAGTFPLPPPVAAP